LTIFITKTTHQLMCRFLMPFSFSAKSHIEFLMKEQK